MKIIFTLIVVLTFPGIVCGGEQDAKKFSSQLPLLFWYTGELWGEVKRGTNTGMTSDEFKKVHKVRFSKLDSSKAPLEHWKFYLYVEDNNGDMKDSGIEKFEGWVFVFSYDGKVWKEVSAERKAFGSTYRLLEADFFTPSMKPQIRQALALYNSNKLAEAVAKRSPKK